MFYSVGDRITNPTNNSPLRRNSPFTEEEKERI
jgi:hypothetical protein